MKYQDAQRHQIEAGAKTERPINPKTIRARKLRRRLTDAERTVRTYLRARQLRGAKFRRQQPLGPYIVDFCCVEPKPIIEVDGGKHAEQIERDSNRTATLEQMGYRVIRFWNNDVLQNTEGVFERIAEEIDILACPDCRGRLRLLATIEDPEIIGKILRHLDLPVDPPEPTPAKALDWLPGLAVGAQ